MRGNRATSSAEWVGETLRHFREDRRGSLAVLFAVALIPILFGLGAAVDYSRSVNFKQQLQGAADAAALAGAGLYTSGSTATSAQTVAKTYMANFANAMGSSYGITYTVTLSSATSGSAITFYAVTVVASGNVANTIMAKLNSASTSVSVQAKAQNPVYTLTLKLSSYSSSASDANTLYYYIVPSDGSAPSSSDVSQFFTNNGTNSTSQFTLQMTGSQKLGFMLKNVTGGRGSNYGRNGYSGSYGSYHYFYSHLFPPSSVAYPSVTKNCSLQVRTSSNSLTTGSCFTSNFTNSAINCAAASTSTWIYYWNDMGGTSDDYDYNDMVYTVTCSQNDTSLNASVSLVQ